MMMMMKGRVIGRRPPKIRNDGLGLVRTISSFIIQFGPFSLLSLLLSLPGLVNIGLVNTTHHQP